MEQRTTPFCEGEARRTLPLAWSAQLPGLDVMGGGASDDAGTTYASACLAEGSASCELVAIGRDGATLFRSALELLPETLDGGPAWVTVVGDVVLVLPRFPGGEARAIQAFRRSDGQLLWGRLLAKELLAGEPLAEVVLAARPLVTRLDEVTLFLRDSRRTGDVDPTLFVVSIDPRSGAVLSRTPTVERIGEWNAATDGMGAVLVTGLDASAQRSAVVRVEVGRGEVWRAPMPEERIAAGELAWASPTRLVVGLRGLFDPRDGSHIAPLSGRPAQSARSDGEGLWEVAAGSASWCGAPLFTHYALDTGESDALCALAPSIGRSTPVLTSRGTLLTVHVEDAETTRLVLSEVDAAGRLVLNAELSGLEVSMSSHPSIEALHQGRLVVSVDGQLLAYDLPEPIDPASHGWVADGGNLQRTGAPR